MSPTQITIIAAYMLSAQSQLQRRVFDRRYETIEMTLAAKKAKDLVPTSHGAKIRTRSMKSGKGELCDLLVGQS